MIPIIVDPFHGEKRFSSDSHFGSDMVSEDSTASTIKRVGYDTSIIFLFITLSLIQFGEDNRKSGMVLTFKGDNRHFGHSIWDFFVGVKPEDCHLSSIKPLDTVS